MVRGRLLELRWSKTVTEEGGGEGGREEENVGPQLVPTTPIIAYAMKEVLREYVLTGKEEKRSDSD